MAYRNYSEAVSHIVDTTGQGDFTTIQAAITAAVSGETIFIRPGTYTENPALKAGVNLTAFGTDASLNGTGTVIINGNCTFSSAGTVTISGIQLQTNSAALLTVSGSSASIVNLINCYINCSNTTGISFTTSNTAAAVMLNDCGGNLGTTGIAFHSMSSTGAISYIYCILGNGGGSSTISSNSAGNAYYYYCSISSPIGTSSTGGALVFYSYINSATQNAIALTANGTGAHTIEGSTFLSGSASAVTVGTGATLSFIASNAGNTAAGTAAITGAGTILTYLPTYSGASFLNNVTTQTSGGTLQGLRAGNAPNAGFIGEQISSYASSVSLVTATSKTITSIVLTPGVWNVDAIGSVTYSVGGNLTYLNISTTNNTLTGNLSDAYSIWNPPTGTLNFSISLNVNQFRVTTSAATTTYYLVTQGNFASGAATGAGRISATRVG